MMMGDNQAGPNTMNMMDMMKQMGMKPERMDRMQLLMRTGVFVDSPAALQVQKDKLQLSPRAGRASSVRSRRKPARKLWPS